VPHSSFAAALVTAFVVSLSPQGAAPLPQVADPPGAPRVPAPLPQVAEIARPPFADWLADLRKEALANGISERTVDAALGNLQPLPIVVERDRTQAERVLPLDEYLKRRLNKKFVKTARERAREHAKLLKKVSSRYGVPASVIVAVWGLESNTARRWRPWPTRSPR
jgi:membrane-bound lytic murein transglycosylase B